LIQDWLTSINYNTVTGISEAQTTTTAPARIYDLAGRLLVEEPSKGIYIKNGKKIIK
jgi:hypothetical protein